MGLGVCVAGVFHEAMGTQVGFVVSERLVGLGISTVVIQFVQDVM